MVFNGLKKGFIDELAKGVQVNLCQKHLFLNQLTRNMTTDCSLIYNFLPRKIQIQNMLCTKIVLNAKTKTLYSLREKLHIHKQT